MNKRSLATPFFALIASLFAGISAASAHAQPVPALSRPFPSADSLQIYKSLLPEIERIPILDNHAHPGFSEDTDADAQSGPPGMTMILRLREDNPELVAASRALFNYPYTDNSPDHQKWLVARKADDRKKYPGVAYFNRVLDQVNIQTGLANRVAMPSYLDPKRFKWVFFVDSFLFPFQYECFYPEYPDDRTFLPLQESKLRREMAEMNISELPADLSGYTALIARSIALHKQQGGVAMKFEAAYFRPLSFGDPSEATAATIYSNLRQGAKPTYRDYLTLQDYLFRRILEQAGQLHLPVHFHTSIGIGDYFSLTRGSVMNLEPVLHDTRYDNISFVLLHAGLPEDQRAIWMTIRKNVYFDTSVTGQLLYPEQLKERFKVWLTIVPERVIFGSDAFSFNDAIGSEEGYWLSTNTSRTALAAALADLISEGVFTHDRALQIAHGYLHDNAARLYGFD